MSTVLSRAVVLVAALAGLVLVEGPVRAEDKPPQKLTLKSGYSGKPLVDGARRVRLSVSLDESGNGSGVLTFDPNVVDGKRSTAAAVREIPVQIQLTRDEEQTTKGRRLYELKKTGPEGKVEEGDHRWFLVKPLKEGTPCWLVIADKDGKVQDVLVLE